MKTQKILTVITTLFLSITIIFLACKKTDTQSESSNPATVGNTNTYASRTNGMEIITDNSTNFVADYELSSTTIFRYSATRLSAGLTVSSLTIHPGTSQVVITYTLDTTVTKYKLNEHTKVKSIANSKKSSFTSTGIATIESQFETFGQLVFDATSSYKTSLVSSMLYHNAIIKTMSRSLVNNSSCGCSPSLEYIVDKAGFWCQEDYKYNRQLVVNVLDTIAKTHNDSLIWNYAKNVATSTEITEIDMLGPIISAEDFLEAVNTIFEDTNTPTPSNFCIFGQGTAWGCCGNYSGCCWLWGDICLIHDLTCIGCTPSWYCGPQCQQG